MSQSPVIKMASRKIQAVLAQMQKNLECSICLEMMQNPVSTACGHQFCRFCIMEFLERKKQVPCPLCKKPVTKRGLVNREQLGQMVSNVQKLIEAYQADTGTLFSPPRGVSMNMLPSTPESIKSKPAKTWRQSNVRRSSHCGKGDRRTSTRGNERLQKEKQTSKNTQPSDTVHEQVGDNAGSHYDSELSAACGTVGEMNLKQVDYQQLLDVIETGSHGATDLQESNGLISELQTDSKVDSNTDTISSRCEGDPKNSIINHSKDSTEKCINGKHDSNSSRSNILDGNKSSCTKNQDESAVHDSGSANQTEEKTAVRTRKEKEEGSIQSDKCSSSQSSTDEVISLFRTPLDVKQGKHSQPKEEKLSVKKTRSLRSAKSASAPIEDLDMKNEAVTLTPDNKTDDELFDKKSDKLNDIKTYSKRYTLDKDMKSKRKVSDWLKNIPDDKSDAQGDKVTVAENKTDDKTKGKSKKNPPKKMTVEQHKEEEMGQRIKKHVGKVNDENLGSLFGFKDLDEARDNSKGVADHNLKNMEVVKETEKQVIEVQCKNSISINSTNNSESKPVQRKRIFKTKATALKNDVEDQNPVPSCENKNGKSNQNDFVEPVQNCGEKQEKVVTKDTSEKPVRQLKLSDSPIGQFQDNNDPYEFRSSQKTPQKPKKKASISRKGKTNKINCTEVVDKSKLKTRSKSKVATFTNVEKSNRLQGNDHDIGKKMAKVVSNTELHKIAAKIDQAEEYDLLTNTQEVLMKMTDNENLDSVYLNQCNDQNETNITKKRVRFKEPVLSEFIHSGKIDIAGYRKEKALCEEQKVSTDSGIISNVLENKCEAKSNAVIKAKADADVLSREINTEKKLNIKDKKEEQSIEDDIENRPSTDAGFEMESQSKEVNVPGSDDLSEDFRFQDDSSGTDDLDINPDHDEFEQPDLEKQPQDIKVQLTAKNSSPNCVIDTPQVLTGPHFRKSFEVPIKAGVSVPKVTNIVAETPLYIQQESEKDTDEKRSLIKEDMNENPIILKPQNHTAGNLTPETVNNNTEHNRLAIEGTIESAPLDFDIETLEEGDGIILDSVAAEESDNEKDDDDEMIHETYTATKITGETSGNVVDTDETQTPNEIITDEDGFVNKHDNADAIEVSKQIGEHEIERENFGSSSCSQNSFSVLEMQYTDRDKCLNGSCKSSSKGETNVEDITTVEKAEVYVKKSQKKKRKCFMLDDTQERADTDTTEDTVTENTPKRQRKVSNKVDSYADVVHSDIVILESTNHLEKEQSEKVKSQNQENKECSKRSCNGSDEIVLISQGSVDIQFSDKKERERQLSGILVSPEDSVAYVSPENIFCIDSEMPTVDFSPEQETQGDENQGSCNKGKVVESLTQKTHVSDTQKSLSQDSVPENKSSKRKSGLKAARGFSKRAKHSDESSSSVTATPKTPKTFNSNETNENTELPGKVAVNIQKAHDQDLIKSLPVVSLNTPRRVNVMKYKSPVAGVKSLTPKHTPALIKSPLTSLSSPAVNRVSKYNRSLQKSLSCSRSTAEEDRLVQNEVEVVEVDACAITVEEIRSSADQNMENCQNRNIQDRNQPNELNETLSTICDDDEDDYENDQRFSKKKSVKKRSPKLRLQLGSQERSKMVEEIQLSPLQSTCIEEADDGKNEKDNLSLQNQDLEGSVRSDKGYVEYSECILDDNIDKLLSKDNKGNEDNQDLGIEKNLGNNYNYKDELTGTQSKETVHRGMHSDSGDLDDNKPGLDEEVPSSPELCYDELSDDEDVNKLQNVTNNDSPNKQSENAKSSDIVNKQDIEYEPTLGPSNITNTHRKKVDIYSVEASLCLDDSDSSDNDEDDHQSKNVNKETKVTVECSKEVDVHEAEVIEESDLDEDPEKPDWDDEIRNVKQLRPKRAILSDSGSESEDESLHLDCTSSSAFSSQSENLTTQERERLETDLEKMAEEMAFLKNQLKNGKAKKVAKQHKDTAMVIRDEEEEMIEANNSDVETGDAPCLSPPPFSPVIISQENTLDDIETQGEVEPEPSCTEIGSKQERSPVRKPLKAIDGNIMREKETMQDISPIKKRNPGFLATGLSSMQVMEVKKVAAVNDIQFYSKICPSVTHVIVRPDETDNRMCDRTLKFFQGIANKCWVVSYQWIVDSKDKGHLLSEKPYEMEGDTTMGCLHQGPKRSRMSKEDLFNGLHFALFGDNKYLNKDCLTELIQTCGGTVAEVSKLDQYGKNGLVICCTDLEEEGSQEEKQVMKICQELKKKYSVVPVKRDWVMDSLTTYKIQPVKMYKILEMD